MCKKYNREITMPINDRTTPKERRKRREFSPDEVQQILQLLRDPNDQVAQSQAPMPEPVTSADPIINRGGAQIRATPGLNITTDRPNVPIQPYNQSPALNQLQQGIAQPQVPAQPQEQVQPQIDPQVQSLFADLDADDLALIQNVYKNIPAEQYNNPQAVQEAAAKAQQAAPVSQRRSRWRKVGNFFKKALPVLGTLGGAVAGFALGGPAGGLAGAVKGGSLGLTAGGIGSTLIPGQQGGRDANGNWLTGKQGGFEQINRFTPGQMDLMNRTAQQGYDEFSNPGNFSPIQDMLSQVIGRNLNNRFNFEPFRQKAEQNFQENTLPGIFERFTSLGKGAQSTGAFQGMLARGGADLNQGLAALEQDYALKNRPLDLQDQQLLQQLLGSQQSYALNRRNLGINALNFGTQSPYETAYRPGQKGAAQAAFPALIEAAGNVGGEYIKNKFIKPTGGCATGNCPK